MIPPSKDYPWYTQEHAGESIPASFANAMLIQQYRQEAKEFENILERTLYAYRKELNMANLPEDVEPVEEQPVPPEELGDPAKFTWEDEEENES